MDSLRKSTKTNLIVYFVYYAIVCVLSLFFKISFSDSGFDMPFNMLLFMVFYGLICLQILGNIFISIGKLFNKSYSEIGDAFLDIIILLIIIFLSHLLLVPLAFGL